MDRIKCRIHRYRIAKKMYYVFVGVKDFVPIKMFVWKIKDNNYFFIPSKVYDAYMIINDDATVDFEYHDRLGYRVHFERLDRYINNDYRASLNERLSVSVDDAYSFVLGMKQKKYSDWRFCVLAALDYHVLVGERGCRIYRSNNKLKQN